MLRLYNTALLPLRAVVALRAAWSSRDPARRAEWEERRGLRLPGIPPGGGWIHGASVGEARIVTSVASALRARRPGLPIAVSATTPTGREALPGPPVADAAFFLPLDFRGPVRRLLDSLRPSALVLVETELWPNLLDTAHASAVPVVVLNGRLAPSRMGRYRRLRALYRPLLARLTAVGARSEEDAERFAELGVPPVAVTVTGNLKYDLPAPRGDAERVLRRLGSAVERPLFVAGSTAPGEEALVLRAFERARREHPALLLVLAPRHVTRTEEVADLVRSQAMSLALYGSRGRLPREVDVLLVDTLGDLPALYGAAQVAFVGGSLVPAGGHNVLEPAAVAVPVLFGPHVESFAEPATALERAGGGRCVRDAGELAAAVAGWLAAEDERAAAGAAARGVVDANRGALERSVELLLRVMDGRARRETSGVA